ncbi:MAG TPA: PAS domain-containing protein, partial [Burkholderiales bacterium]|nr:PAS domain-containing protein [Burkholderiales bacterium]
MASQPGPVFISGHQRLAATLLRTARWSVGVSALIAALALFGHYADIEALARFVPEWPAVRPAGNLAILCTAAGFGLLQSSRRKSGFALLGMTALAILVALLLPHTAPLPGGPLNVYSGSVLLIIIAGTTLVHLPDRGHLVAARALAMASATLIFIAGIGISFRLLLALPPLVQVSFPALLALLCLTYAIVAVRCDAWVIRLLTSPRPGAVMTRRLLPVVLLLPVVIGWIDVGAQRAGLLDYAFGTVLQTVLTVVALAAVMLWGARSLDSIDVRRSEAERQALAQREWLHVTINSCGEPVVATDAAGAVRLVNPAAEVLAGQCAYDLIGRQITEVFPLTIDDASSIEHPVMSVLSGARFADINREFKFARGEQERYVDVT